VLTALGALLPFEIAVGLNGVVWVRAATGAWRRGDACDVSHAPATSYVILLSSAQSVAR